MHSVNYGVHVAMREREREREKFHYLATGFPYSQFLLLNHQMGSRVVVSVDSELTPCMNRSDRVVKCRQTDLV